jgi:hypothetical protein
LSLPCKHRRTSDSHFSFHFKLLQRQAIILISASTIICLAP